VEPPALDDHAPLDAVVPYCAAEMPEVASLVDSFDKAEFTAISHTMQAQVCMAACRVAVVVPVRVVDAIVTLECPQIAPDCANHMPVSIFFQIHQIEEELDMLNAPNEVCRTVSNEARVPAKSSLFSKATHGNRGAWRSNLFDHAAASLQDEQPGRAMPPPVMDIYAGSVKFQMARQFASHLGLLSLENVRPEGTEPRSRRRVTELAVGRELFDALKVCKCCVRRIGHYACEPRLLARTHPGHRPPSAVHYCDTWGRMVLVSSSLHA
jgi:hypothetical protein